MSKFQKAKKGLAALLACTVLASSLPMMTAAAQEATGEEPFIATPYTKEDGTLAEGLEQAVLGKHHWLETTEALPVTVEENTSEGILTIGNGVIQRQFKLPQIGGTEFYTKSYKNLYIDKELLKDEAKPDVYLGLYDKPYEEVYHDSGVKSAQEAFSDGVIQFDPDYYFIGGASAENAFVFDGYTVSDCEKPFEWSPDDVYGDPAAEDWPPKGKHIEFNFSAPDTFPEAYQGVKVKVIYEMYDNLSAMKKRVEITNSGDQQIMVGRLAPEILNGTPDLDELLTLETSYTCGDQSTLPINMDLPCNCVKEKADSPFRELADIQHTCYEVGPAYELLNGQTFASFDTYELIHSTYWFELQMREHLGMYRKLFPWITDNPLTFHCTAKLTKAIIDHAAGAGFEMIIQSYSAPDSSAQMLTRNQANLDYYKELIDYAHSKNIDIGIYQAQYQRNQYKGGAEYGTNGIGTWNTWCLASAAFDDYWDNFKYFCKYTGVDCVEIDGPYPGCYCNNGAHHVNADKETDPDPEGTDKETETASKYAVHKGYFDSKVKQWENSVRLLCKDFRDMGVYIKVPGWYYVNGGNKCGIGYEEVAWSAPRQEQLLYARQLMHNASYARTMSMSWSHIPFAQYQGGGSAAMFQPFKDHMEDYNWVMAQNLGNGVTSDFRGPALCDDETESICNKWVNFYNRYRGIVNSDMVHISQAMYEDEKGNRARGEKMDTLYHVNANNPGEKGLLWVYNQTDEVRTETITVPMYYTGLTNLNYPPVPLKDSMGKDVHTYGIYPPNYDWLPDSEPNYRMPDVTDAIVGNASFVREGVEVEDLTIDSNGNAHLTVTLPPMSFTYYAVYPEGAQPDVAINVGQVKNVAAKEATEHAVTLSWDKNVQLTLTEDGVVNEQPTIGIDSFNIYRDDELVGTSMTNSYTDDNLTENTEYRYTVEAVSAGVTGAKSEVLLVATPKDETKPVLQKADAITVEQILLTFSEPVDKASAEDVSNYSLSGGKQVKAAALTKENQVTLTVDALDALVSYQLTVQNIKDISQAVNVLEPVEKEIIYGYVAKYTLDDGNTGTLADTFGSANGKAYRVQTAELDYGKAARFVASSNAYADLGTGLFNGLNTYSISLWINPAADGKQVLLSQGQEGMPEKDMTLYLEDGLLKFRQSSADAQAVELASTEQIANGAWSLVTLVRSGDTFTLYVNKQQVDTKTVSGIGTADSQNALLMAAMKNNAGGDRTLFYTGMIDEAGLYKVALTEQQIADLYASNALNYDAQLKAAKAISGNYYTQASFQTLQAAISSLEEKLTGGGTVPAEVLQAAEALETAVKGLEKKEEYKTLAAYYPMNEAQGADVLDVVSGSNGELTNGDYLRMGTPFQKGIYFTFNRANYLTIPSNPVAGENAYTISGWFKSQLYLDTDLNRAGKQVLLADGGQVVLSLTNNVLSLELSNGQENKNLTASKQISYDTVTGGEVRPAWNHFAVVKNGDQYILYLNGEAVAQDSLSGVNLGASLTVGINGTDQFNGILDELTFHSEALTTEKIFQFAGELSLNKGTQTNIALNKTLMSDNMDDAFRINDGKVLEKASTDTPWTARGKGQVGNSGLKFGFDLGEVYEINALSLTEFYRDYGNEQLRRFRDVVIQISTTSDFSSGVTTVFNTDDNNTMGYGKGGDQTYYSFDLGYDIVLDTPVRGRYVRLINSGFYDQNGSYQAYANVAELEVYGQIPEPAEAEVALSRDSVTMNVVGDREFVRVTTDIDNSAADAVVTSDQESVATVTNKNGILQINAIGAGTAVITVQHPKDASVTKQIQVTVKGLTPKAVIDDADASIRYEGNFKVFDTNRGADPDGVYEYNKGIHYTNERGDYAEYTFIGTGIDVITTVNVDQGAMEIFIDGVSQGKVNTLVPNDTYPKRANQMNVFSKNDLPYGQHTVKVVNLVSSAEAGVYRGMTIDAFRVYEELPDSDKTDLQALYRVYQDMEQGDYTDSSWAKFITARENAKVVLDNVAATQEMVDAAYDALQAVIDQLTEKADFTALNRIVEEYGTLNEKDYTAESWSAFQTVLAEAKTVLGNADATQGVVDNAYNNLVAARLALVELIPADKTELDALIAATDKIDTSNSRPGKLAAYKDALAHAKEISEKADATQDEVNAASDALLEAIVNLKDIVDKTNLNNLMNTLSQLKAEDYTAESFAVLTEALAQAALIDDDSSVAEVTAAYKGLQAANAQLVRVPKVNKEALANAIKKAQIILDNLDSFKPNSVIGLQEALNKAQAVYDDPAATQAQVKEATDALTAANANAQVKEDKEVLFKAIEKAEALNAKDYTAESFAELTRVLAAAKLVAQDDNAGKEQVAAAAKSIESAIAKLQKAGDGSGSSSKPNGGSSNGSSSTGDSGNVLPAVLALAISLLGAAALVLGKRKRHI